MNWRPRCTAHIELCSEIQSFTNAYDQFNAPSGNITLSRAMHVNCKLFMMIDAVRDDAANVQYENIRACVLRARKYLMDMCLSSLNDRF